MKDEPAIFNGLMWSHRAERVVQVANSLDVFTILAGRQLRAEEISQICNSKPDLTARLLIACAAMGLLEKRDNSYANTALAQKYLVRSSPLYQGHIIAHSANVWKFWDELPEEIGVDLAKTDDAAMQHKNFILGMNDITVGGRGEIFLEAVDLTGRKKLFDVGGGPGTYSVLACRKYPELRAIVFDLPETVAIAKEMIAAENMADRIAVQPGNWDEDDFGEDNDVVLFSNVLHGPASEAETKLRKAYDSMTAGGLLAVQEFLLNDEKSGPLIPALFNIMVGAYSTGELVRVIETAGFENARLVTESEELGAGWITAQKPKL